MADHSRGVDIKNTLTNLTGFCENLTVYNIWNLHKRINYNFQITVEHGAKGSNPTKLTVDFTMTVISMDFNMKPMFV